LKRSPIFSAELVGMSDKCCPECFGDRSLRKDFFPFLSKLRGTCDFCHSENQDLLEPGRLADYFEMLVSIYEPDPKGESLVDWLKTDWQLFDHPRMDVARAKMLLSEILDDGEIVRKKFAPSKRYDNKGLAQWGTLRDELLSKNRYFLDEELDADRLRGLLDHLIEDEIPDTWYRARIISGNTSYSLSEMEAPPGRLATSGRANPAGIPYLYLGSIPETAVSELRPHTGEEACVARFTLPPSLKTVDLRNPRKLVSPFGLVDATAIDQLRADIPLLERLGQELTRPVIPRSAAIDYIPSQYICEFIKKNNFDGVLYSSSVSDGINLALFDPEKAKAESLSRYNITRVTVDVDQVLT
jgi:hypothetical protein